MSKKQPRMKPARVHALVEDLFAEDMHAKRVLSLGNAVVGALAAKEELGLCPWRFAGQHEETGLYYNRFRYYESHAASYIKQDPKGLAGGLRQ